MNEVGFWDFFSGLGEGFGEGGVVGEDDEAGGGAVEAAGEVELRCPWFIDQVDDGFVSGISRGRENAGGLVEEEITRSVCLKHFTTGGEVIEFSERKCAVGDELVVEYDLS